jgi:hypothetical protein
MHQLFERNLWRRNFVHEAGHAVASMPLLNRSADIVAMNYIDEDGRLQKHARFKYTPGVRFRNPADPNAPPIGEQSLFEKAQIIGAGGMAETLYFCGPPQGAAKDLAALAGILMAIAPISADLHDTLRRERDANFPETRRLLKTHWKAVRRIWKKAFYEFKRKRMASKNEFRETAILYDSEVRRLFHG